MLDLPALDTGEHRGYRTLAGFLLTRLGRVPATGDVGLASGAEFTILTTDGRRIARVRIVRSTA